MGATGWFLVAFAAVVVVILLTVWGALVLEAGGRAPERESEAARPVGEPDEAHTPEERAA